MVEFPCICGHMSSDHGPNDLGNDSMGESWGDESDSFGAYLDTGDCDCCGCEAFDEMDNLQYVEWMEKGKQHDKNRSH